MYKIYIYIYPGIKGLAKLLSEEAPDSIREVTLKSLQGRKIAVDASMAIYQFLIAVRSSSNGYGGGGGATAATMLTNADGETTSHIQGLFNRTVRFLTEGIQPIYVFDGKPPTLKSNELQLRRQRREQAQEALQLAEESGNVEEQDKQSKRLVRAGQKENDDCRTLLEYMGCPMVMAPCEAEAQAASLTKLGIVYATATEDMDALTFGAPILLRKMTFAGGGSGSNNSPMIQSINYEMALKGLQLSKNQFIDLCILLGCDYCDTIRGVGPKTALKLIREHGNIETIIQYIQQEQQQQNPKKKNNNNKKNKQTTTMKYVIPSDWLPPCDDNNNNNKKKKNNSSSTKSKEEDDDDDNDSRFVEEEEEDDDDIDNEELDQEKEPEEEKKQEVTTTTTKTTTTTTTTNEEEEEEANQNKEEEDNLDQKHRDKEMKDGKESNDNKQDNNNKEEEEEDTMNASTNNNNNNEEKDHDNDANGNDKVKDDDDEFIPAFVMARKLFTHHEVLDTTKDVSSLKLKWKPCQPDQLREFLVTQMGFNPDRVSSSIDKLQKAYQKNLKPQTRLDNFFTMKQSNNKKLTTSTTNNKNNKNNNKNTTKNLKSSINNNNNNNNKKRNITTTTTSTNNNSVSKRKRK